jgi:hypothetical protein
MYATAGFYVPAANVRLSTRPTETPGYLYVSLVDLNPLVAGSQTPLPLGTYTGQIVADNVQVAIVVLDITKSDC